MRLGKNIIRELRDIDNHHPDLISDYYAQNRWSVFLVKLDDDWWPEYIVANLEYHNGLFDLITLNENLMALNERKHISFHEIFVMSVQEIIEE